MPKQNQVSLQELKAEIITEAAKREAVVAQGARAYQLGIELYNNPVSAEGPRKLWEIGWTKARDTFNELLRRNGGTMR
jgi:hypothetical protein